MKYVYEFTNKRKLTKREFIRWFEKKFLYTIRKFQMIKKNDIVGYEKKSDFRGIVLESLLKMFAEKFADADKIKIVPAYFPFTEPSAELHAKHPEMGWIELGGAGIFRPELTKPLGIEVPVLAWGLGIDRIAMFKLGIKDIRDLYSNNLGFLRSSKTTLE